MHTTQYDTQNAIIFPVFFTSSDYNSGDAKSCRDTPKKIWSPNLEKALTLLDFFVNYGGGDGGGKAVVYINDSDTGSTAIKHSQKRR
jgi:hypothetical protein